MNTFSLARKVKEIEILTKKHVLGLFSGMYASVFKGRGIEVGEVREFQEGDDIRAISWSKTASMGKPFVKEFAEERDLTIMLVVDISGSMQFGSKNGTKREMVAQIAALIAFCAIYNHDRVGLILYSDKLEKHIKPKRGTKHGVRLIRDFLAFEAQDSKTDLKGALEYLYTAERRRMVCFFLSDFIDTSFEKPMSFVARKDDLVSIRITDPLETTLPSIGRTSLQDLETGEQIVVQMNSTFAQRFADTTKECRLNTGHTILKTGSGLIDISTEDSFINKLRTYFAARKKQR